MGRRSKLTPELQAELCEKIMAHCTFEEACTLVDVDASNAHRWMKKGLEQKRGKFRAFRVAVEKANAMCIASLKAGIRVHGRHDWKALAALGAMKAPKQFIPQVRVVIEKNTDDVLDAARDVLEKDHPELYAAVLHAVVAKGEAAQATETPTELEPESDRSDTPPAVEVQQPG